MEQQRALNALEPFLALSKSATSPRAAADLITQATSAPNTYVFAELLQTPNIQALRESSDYASHLRLLEIFAWGTYTDYTSTPNLPALSPSQQTKLSLLSLLPLCTSPTTLTYTSLTHALSLPSAAALEHLITTAIYAGLLHGNLDPLHRTVAITSIAPLRDLAPNSVPSLVSTLDAWDGRCTDLLEDINGRVREIRRKAYEDKVRERRRENAFEREVAKEDGFGGGGGGGSGGVGKGGKRAAPEQGGGSGVGGDAMDVDQQIMGRGGSRVKRGGGSRTVMSR